LLQMWRFADCFIQASLLDYHAELSKKVKFHKNSLKAH